MVCGPGCFIGGSSHLRRACSKLQKAAKVYRFLRQRRTVAGMITILSAIVSIAFRLRPRAFLAFAALRRGPGAVPAPRSKAGHPGFRVSAMGLESYATVLSRTSKGFTARWSCRQGDYLLWFRRDPIAELDDEPQILDVWSIPDGASVTVIDLHHMEVSNSLMGWMKTRIEARDAGRSKPGCQSKRRACRRLPSKKPPQIGPTP